MGNCLPGTQRSILPLAPRDSGAHLPAPLPSSGLCWRFSGPGPSTCRQPAAQGRAGGMDPGRPTLTGLDQRGGARREDAGSCSGMALGGGVANVGESPASAPPESWRLGERVACGVEDTPLSTPRPPSDLVSWLSDTDKGAPRRKGLPPSSYPPKVVRVHGAHIQIPVIPGSLRVAPGAAREAVWFPPGPR